MLATVALGHTQVPVPVPPGVFPLWDGVGYCAQKSQAPRKKDRDELRRLWRQSNGVLPAAPRHSIETNRG